MTATHTTVCQVDLLCKAGDTSEEFWDDFATSWARANQEIHLLSINLLVSRLTFSAPPASTALSWVLASLKPAVSQFDHVKGQATKADECVAMRFGALTWDNPLQRMGSVWCLTSRINHICFCLWLQMTERVLSVGNSDATILNIGLNCIEHPWTFFVLVIDLNQIKIMTLILKQISYCGICVASLVGNILKAFALYIVFFYGKRF